MNTQILTKELLETLYLSGKSMPEIATSLNCSINKVVYWMNKYGIARRSWSEAVYLKSNPNGDPFTILKTFSPETMLLYGLGLGLYWGEGEKTSKHAVRLANSDPFVIKAFRDFLITICKLEERKILYALICFNDSNPEDARTYWAKILNISGDKFGKITQIPPQGKGRYKKKSQFGVCILIVGNIKLKTWIIAELEKLKARIV